MFLFSFKGSFDCHDSQVMPPAFTPHDQDCVFCVKQVHGSTSFGILDKAGMFYAVVHWHEPFPRHWPTLDR